MTSYSTFDQYRNAVVMEEIDRLMNGSISVDEEELVKPLAREPLPAPGLWDRITVPQMTLLWEQNRKREPRVEPFGEYEKLSAHQQQMRRLTAYWATKGASHSLDAALIQGIYADEFKGRLAALMTANILASRLQQRCGDNAPPLEDWVPDFRRQTFGYLMPCRHLLPEGDAYLWMPEVISRVSTQFNAPVPIPDIRRIIDRCPQMAMIYALRGNVGEPYWWAALSITEHSTPNYSIRCSDGYPTFSVEEVEYRASRIKKEGTKPARCARMNDVHPGVCPTCKYYSRINSPIALGYPAAPRIEEGMS